MTALNEYLGNIVASITQARVTADMQSVLVAEEYAKHPLLQHFSVPRMRIQDVELTIPVALQSAQEKTETVIGPVDLNQFTEYAYQQAIVGIGEPKVSAQTAKSLRQAILQKAPALEQKMRAEKSLAPLQVFAHEALATAILLHHKIPVDRIPTTMSAPGSMPQTPMTAMPSIANQPGNALPPNFDLHRSQLGLADKLGSQLKVTSQTKSLDKLAFEVVADKIREQKPENIIYIKLKISEDGMEWHRTEDGTGKIQSTLHPE
jgi:hypothetical protein